ncbi:hypothetical protein JTE90_000881 [Oedothorax gibbosus]|uniref:Uncharacterized protein n=1 Tax=Oedothorax gibbosus TaxID=931172 RepID=A0AAV6VVI1_9ARAC|nr:hypothetical protein JTE90_000881 [Oedothorax gibbosus]
MYSRASSHLSASRPGSPAGSSVSSMWSSPCPSSHGDSLPEKEGSVLEPGQKEERFRIDRKKLEDMIQTPHATENADVFFQRVMLETSTQISWPSKLKIGAKSKKDPHVKVVGTPEAVQMAKEMILEILDTKKDRVTLKMDVSYKDHSYIIGKGGFKIQQVMEETGCHIHFPDSNRNGLADKSNQVSIAGQAQGVELARAKIRELLPLEFSFELPGGAAVKPGDDPAIQHIQQTYSFNVSFRPLGAPGRTLLTVRGCQRLLPRLRQGLGLLMEYLTGSKAIPVLGFLQTEVAAQHQAFVQGVCGAHAQTIQAKTGARLLFPDPASSPTPGLFRSKSTVVIQGSFDGVCLAWQELLKRLPMVLMFDLREGQELDPVAVSSYMEAFDVSVMVRPKLKDNTKSVLVRGAEKDSDILFRIRRDILGLQEDDSVSCSSFSTAEPTYRRDFQEQTPLTAESLSILSSLLHPQVLGLLHRLPGMLPQPVASPQPPRVQHYHKQFPSRSVESWIDRSFDYSAAPNFMQHKDATLEDGDSGIFLPTNNRFFGGSRYDSSSRCDDRTSRAESSASSTSSDTQTDHSRYPTDYGLQKRVATNAVRQGIGEGSGARRPNTTFSGYGFSKSMPDFTKGNKNQDSGSISEFLENEVVGETMSSSKPWMTDVPEKNDNPLEQVPSPFGLSNFWERLPTRCQVQGSTTTVDYASVSSLEELLSLLDLEFAMESFWHHEIDLQLFTTLTEQDLQKLGFGYMARRKMLAAIAALREQRSSEWNRRRFLAAPGAERERISSSRHDSEEDRDASPAASTMQ